MTATRRAVAHMRADLERLDRVAHRFERIGREPQLRAVDVGELVDRIGDATSGRACRRSRNADRHRRRTIARRAVPIVRGDAVLLEWAVEVLTKNAIDALAGRGGRMYARRRAREPTSGVRFASPTTGRAFRASCARASSSPASPRRRAGGASASRSRKRIVEENHGGKLAARAVGARRDVRDYSSRDVDMLLD